MKFGNNEWTQLCHIKRDGIIDKIFLIKDETMFNDPVFCGIDMLNDCCKIFSVNEFSISKHGIEFEEYSINCLVRPPLLLTKKDFSFLNDVLKKCGYKEKEISYMDTQDIVEIIIRKEEV